MAQRRRSWKEHQYHTPTPSKEFQKLRHFPPLAGYQLHQAVLAQIMSFWPRDLEGKHQWADWTNNAHGHTLLHPPPGAPCGLLNDWPPHLQSLANVGNSQLAHLFEKCTRQNSRACIFLLDATTESYEKLHPFASVIAYFPWDPRTLTQPKNARPALFKTLTFFFIPSFRLHATDQICLNLKIHHLWEANLPVGPPNIRWEDIEPLLQTFPVSETLFLLRDALKIGAIINFKGERMKFHPCTPSKTFFLNSTPELRAKDFKAGFRSKDFPFSGISLTFLSPTCGSAESTRFSKRCQENPEWSSTTHATAPNPLTSGPVALDKTFGTCSLLRCKFSRSLAHLHF